jgi:hypothetical protein
LGIGLVRFRLEEFKEGFQDGEGDRPDSGGGGVFLFEVFVEAREAGHQVSALEAGIRAIQFGEPLAHGT